MRYLKKYESNKNIENDIYDIKSILQNLIDDYWNVTIQFIDNNRWTSDQIQRINFHVNNAATLMREHILVSIRKESSRPGSKYSLGAEFDIKLIKDEISTIFSMYSNNKIDLKICDIDLYEDEYDQYLRGIWDKISMDSFINFLNSPKSDLKVIGLEVKIYL